MSHLFCSSQEKVRLTILIQRTPEGHLPSRRCIPTKAALDLPSLAQKNFLTICPNETIGWVLLTIFLMSSEIQ